MYRPDWFPTDRSVVQIALDVHSACIGSSDVSPEDKLSKDVYALKWVVNNWQESRCDFDDAVYALIRHAIDEWEKSR